MSRTEPSCPSTLLSEIESQVRYRLIEELSQSERLHRELIQHLRVIVIRCKGDGRISFVNEAWETILGHKVARSLDRPLLDFVHPHDRQRLMDQCAAHRGMGADSARPRELRLTNVSGDVVYMDVSIWHDADDGAIVSLHDMSLRKEAEQELQQARDAADAANRLKGAFLANMSHEIRTPMSVVLGFTDALLDPNLSEADRRGYIERIQRNGRHLLTIINDILDFSQIEEGKLPVVPEPLGLHDLLSALEQNFAARAGANGIDFVIDVQPGVPSGIMTDRTRVEQILANLIDNAVKFTHRGRVEVAVQLIEGGRSLRFSVADTGIGIAPGRLESLFEPFRQEDLSHQRLHGGNGLGLAICRGLAALLGGRIEGTSELGSGSRFELIVPCEAVEVLEVAPRLSTAITDSSPRRRVGRALLAEDTHDMAVLISRRLEGIGLNVTVARDGAEAKDRALQAAAAGAPYDVIFMDMQMPLLDGYSAARQLRDLGYSGPIIALTAHALSGDRQACLDAGCDEYVAKPVKRDELAAVVRRFVGSRYKQQTTWPETAGKIEE